MSALLAPKRIGPNEALGTSSRSAASALEGLFVGVGDALACGAAAEVVAAAVGAAFCVVDGAVADSGALHAHKAPDRHRMASRCFLVTIPSFIAASVSPTGHADG